MEGISIPVDENYNHLLCIYLPIIEMFFKKENIKGEDYPIYCIDKHKDVLKKYSKNILPIEHKPKNIFDIEYDPRCLNQDLISKVKKTLMKDLKKEKQKECIFITRQNRKIKNERKILKIFENTLNTEIRHVDFCKMSFDEQISICNSSKIMIGVHGAGLTNMMFMENNSMVFEIDPFEWEYYCGCEDKHNVYGHLAKCLNMKNYVRIHQPNFFSREVEDFEINLNDLQEKLNFLE